MWRSLSILLLSCAGIFAAKTCSIKLPQDLNGFAPVILTKTSAKNAVYKIFKPTARISRFAEGTSFHLACPGLKNTITTRRTKSSLDLKCKAGRFVEARGRAMNLKTIRCKAIPKSTLKATTMKCSLNRGLIHKVGVAVKGKLYQIFEICYDRKAQVTYYSHNTLPGSVIKYNVVLKARRPFEATGMKYNTATIYKYYSQTNQKKIFVKLFGAKQTYMDKNNFLARGHLTPHVDFVLGYEQLSTYYYMNVAPEFQPVNAGNWVRVENIARRMAAAYGTNIESYNGYMDRLKLARSSRALVNIYLDPKQEFPIPKYFFKVLWHKASNSALVFISLNNPHSTKGKAEEFCPNICGKAKVPTTGFSDAKRGHTFCCSLTDFVKTFKGLPDYVKASKLLMYK